MNPFAISNRLRCLLSEPHFNARKWISSRAFASTFKYDDLEIVTKDIDLNENPFKEELQFGSTFTDHMLEIKWTESKGWEKPIISPLHNFSLHPASKVFHYAQELFEGMKAYYCIDGKIRLFRPQMNMSRMLRTAKRAGLAEFDENELLKCIKKLIQIDKRWVPNKPNHSLYIRPTFMGTEATLGVASAKESILFCILSPVGSYFKNKLEPIALFADPNAVRAFPKGVGNYKLGSNYGPTIKIQQNAVKEGCQQVLWLFGDDHQLTEVGTVNIFVYLINENNEKELITPPLEDELILPGITRDSVLTMTREWNEFKVTEKRITMKEVQKALKENRLVEIFGAGTACIVSPVNRIKYQNENIILPTDETHKISQRILNKMTEIYYGQVSHKWMLSIDE